MQQKIRWYSLPPNLPPDELQSDKIAFMRSLLNTALPLIQASMAGAQDGRFPASACAAVLAGFWPAVASLHYRLPETPWLASNRATHTALATVFPGRPAGGMVNHRRHALGYFPDTVPAFPLAGRRALTADRRGVHAASQPDGRPSATLWPNLTLRATWQPSESTSCLLPCLAV